MKPVRFVAVLLALGLFVTAFAPVRLSDNAVQKSITTSSAPVEGFKNAALDLAMNSPLTFLAGAPVVTFAVESVPSATANYACSLMAQTPADWTSMGRRQYFDAKWTVKNVGTKYWGIHGIDLRFMGGTHMHTYGDIYDLRANTAPGRNVVLIVDMNAPKLFGYYTAYWGLYTGSSVFCRLSISVVVNHY